MKADCYFLHEDKRCEHRRLRVWGSKVFYDPSSCYLVPTGYTGGVLFYRIGEPVALNLCKLSLTPQELRTAFDDSFLRGMQCLVEPRNKLLQWFLDLWPHRDKVPVNLSRVFSQTVADYVERVGVEVDLDKKTKGVVILKSDVDRMRKGELG